MFQKETFVELWKYKKLPLQSDHLFIIVGELTFALQLGKYLSNHSRPLNCVMKSGRGLRGLGGGEGDFGGGGVGSLGVDGARIISGLGLGGALETSFCIGFVGRAIVLTLALAAMSLDSLIDDAAWETTELPLSTTVCSGSGVGWKFKHKIISRHNMLR